MARPRQSSSSLACIFFAASPSWLASGHGDLGQLRLRAGLHVVAHAADGERSRLVAFDDGDDDRRHAIALVQPRQRRDVADIGLLDRQGVLVELVAAHHGDRHGRCRGVEPAPGIAPGVAVVERLQPVPALPQRNDEGRARHRLGERDVGLAEPRPHRIGVEHHAQRGDVAVARAALALELDAAHQPVEPRIVDRRDARAVLGRDHALDQQLDALLLRLADALLARLDGVGGRHVDVDVADRVGFAAGGDLGLRGAGK